MGKKTLENFAALYLYKNYHFIITTSKKVEPLKKNITSNIPKPGLEAPAPVARIPSLTWLLPLHIVKVNPHFIAAFPADPITNLWTTWKRMSNCPQASTQGLQDEPQPIFLATSPIILLQESFAPGKNVAPIPHNSKNLPRLPRRVAPPNLSSKSPYHAVGKWTTWEGSVNEVQSAVSSVPHPFSKDGLANYWSINIHTMIRNHSKFLCSQQRFTFLNA